MYANNHIISKSIKPIAFIKAKNVGVYMHKKLYIFDNFILFNPLSMLKQRDPSSQPKHTSKLDSRSMLS